MSEFYPDINELPPRGRRVAFTTNPLMRRSVKIAAAANMKFTPRVTATGSVAMAAAATMTFTPSLTRLALVPYTAEQLLDQESPRRLESFRFDVMEPDGTVVGRLAVIGVSQITNDVSRRIKRDVSGLTVPPRPPVAAIDADLYFAEDVDTQRHRIKVVHVLGNGGDEYELPWGVFVFATDPRYQRTYGDTLNGSLVDLSQIFDQKVVQSQTWPAGTGVSNLLRELFDAVGIPHDVESTSVTLGGPVTMLALQDSRQSVAEAVCTLAGFLPPYFSNEGVGVCRSAPDASSTTPTLQYGSQSRAYNGTVIASSALLVAPNIWIAEAGSGTEQPIVGTWRLPADDPHSIENIGYAIPEQVDVQGIDTQAAADEAARAAGVTSLRQLRRRTWSSPIDSRHDTYDAIGWDDEVLLEQSWSADLVYGGTMTHDAVVIQ